MACWDVFSVVLMLVPLRNLSIKVEKALIDWINLDEFVKFVINKLRDVFGIIFMLVVNVSSFLKHIIGVLVVVLEVSALIWEVISVPVVVSDLNHGVSMESVGFVMLFVGLLLDIVSLVVFMVESIVVAIWRELCVVKFFMIVSDSLHILWSVNNIWVMWGLVIISLSSMDSLSEVVEFIPFSAFLGLRVQVVVSSGSESMLNNSSMTV